MISTRLSEQEMSRVFTDALAENNLIHSADTAMVFYDLDFLSARIKDLQNQFPPETLHAIAVKANPLTNILSKIKAAGVGAEVASLAELYLAEKAGFTPGNIVFDSPCKTKPEIEYALQKSVCMNADSFDELDRIADILATTRSTSNIGVRINPQIGPGRIKSTSVADGISKFGIPLNTNKDRIIEYFLKFPWLTSIHVHIGSQGCPVPLIIDGIRKVLDLTIEINATLQKESRENKISVFDLGGGLPVSYHPGQAAVDIEHYVAMLKSDCSELFDGGFRLITEFGRYIYANTGWVASKVEYVKKEPGYNMIMTHVGADLFLRKAYNPNDWHHHITIIDKNGVQKTETNTARYTVAGPLCFGGDVIATDIELPWVEEGDYLLIHDAGAYTLSMWSRYNSRQMPKVIGYHKGSTAFEILKTRESKDDLLEFWS